MATISYCIIIIIIIYCELLTANNNIEPTAQIKEGTQPFSRTSPFVFHGIKSYELRVNKKN